MHGTWSTPTTQPDDPTMPEIDNTPSRRNLSRREFLGLAAGAVVLACTGCARPDEPRIGLALGGGGAKGLAHILMLEAFDALGIRPHLMAGTSIGAIIGALYAAGLSGTDIRALIEQFLVTEQDADSLLPGLPRSLRWLDFIDPEINSGGLLDSNDFIEFIGEQLPVQRFRKLAIPLKVVTAELLTGKQVVIKSGLILPALQASMAVPGVFRPVELDGRELVDGGVANPLPYDLLVDKCDVVVAIDVSGNRELEDGESLSSVGVLMHSFHTMSNNIMAEKLRQQRPDIYIRPNIRNVRVLEFYKAKQVFEQAQPAQRQLLKALKKALRAHPGRPGCTAG
jgi:NTE family protein